MKHLFLICLVFLSIAGGAAACRKDNGHHHPDTENENDGHMESTTIKISVGSKTFTATLPDNKTAKAFREMLPLSIKMTELNGNEKYFDLPGSLPGNPSNPGTIQNGDLMLFGSKTLVLFYKSFSTSYSYTKLGRINDPSDLAAALGTGDVTVTFELE